MLIDRLTKEKYYIPCTTNKNGTTAKATTYLLLNNVWKLHGLPLSLTSDRGPQFISGYRKISIRFLALKLTYLRHFTWKQMGRGKLPIKKWKDIFALLLTISKITGREN